MKKSLRFITWFIFIIIILALLSAWISVRFKDNANYWDELLSFFWLILRMGSWMILLYGPFIWLIQQWWIKTKKRKLNSKWWQSQTAKSIQKFVMNGSAMAGGITIIYAMLIALFAHLISPDNSPNANDQINELAYHAPGFTINLLEQPLALQKEPQNFFYTMMYGKKSEVKLIPFQSGRYWYSGDSIFISRYIGPGVKGVTTGFSLESITGKKLKGADQIKIIEQENISKRKFILGTDDLGRDYLSRIMLGIRISLSIGFVAVMIALFIGIPVGAIAGFYKSSPPRIKFRNSKSVFRLPVDDIVMWMINVIWAIPTLLLVFPVVFAFGQNYYTIFIAVGLTMWVDIARIVRAQVMQVRELEFVQAAKTFAYSDMRTIFRHILPNIAGPVIVITAANFAYAILTEAGLSFLGIGVQPPAPSWGLMISKYKDNLITNPYLPLLPGFAITILVLAFFMIGNGLRDALDVKSGIHH